MYDQTSASARQAPTSAKYLLRTSIAGALLAESLIFPGTFIPAAIAADPVSVEAKVTVSRKTSLPTDPPDDPCPLRVIMDQNKNYKFTEPDEGQEAACSNDNHYFWSVSNMPSGTLVTFYDKPNCLEDKDQRFYFTIRITANNTTTGSTYNNHTYPEKERFSDMAKYDGVSPPPMIQPGIRYEDGFWAPGQSYDGKLSCVRISRVK